MALHAATPPADAYAVAPEPDAPRATRIILDRDQSAHLDATGSCFAIVARGSWPDAAGRYVLHAIPSTVQRIDKAVAVAKGELLTRKPPSSS